MSLSSTYQYFFWRDFLFYFIACASARNTSCDTQVLYPIAMSLAIKFGLFPHQNPSLCLKIRHFTAFSAYLLRNSAFVFSFSPVHIANVLDLSRL